ncbi:MAG: adenine deaminase [Planctomycetes bacterium]|nr:adenine deaminase [Planctomycetota bacterium]
MRITTETLRRRVDQALSREPADVVVRGGRILDVTSGELVEGDVAICGDTIVGTLERYEGRTVVDARGKVVAPGFVDTHVHVESTMVTPVEFDRCVLPHGTTTAICDPHEISNVLGLEGLRYFLDAAGGLTMDLRVQLSSCVPATDLETSGASLSAADLLPLRSHPQVIGLAELMNFPGVLHHDPGVLEKLAAFSDGHVDGHCPLLRGKELNAYVACGIRNCHESTRLDEAREKLRKGLQVLLRDGSVSKDVRRLAPLLTDVTSPFLAFCTDDRNPLDIAEEGHVDHLVREAIATGVPVGAAYRAATWSAARGFGLRDRGLVAPGQLADLVLLDDLEDVRVGAVLRRGRVVTEETLAATKPGPDVGRRSVRLAPVTADVFRTPAPHGSGPVIGVVAGSIVTEALSLELPHRDGRREADPARGVHKVAVLARHGKNRNVGRGFVRGFGFRTGALASSVGHDSHNVIVVGASDVDMAVAVNRLLELEGGFVAVVGGKPVAELPLPLAGLLSDRPFGEVRDRLRTLRAAVRAMGCPLAEPFLQLAFLPLPVIPHLKITDRGLVDVDRFALVG